MTKENARIRRGQKLKSPNSIPNKRQKTASHNCNDNSKKNLTKSTQKFKMSFESINSRESCKIEIKNAVNSVSLIDVKNSKGESKIASKISTCTNDNCSSMEEKDELNGNWKLHGELLEALSDALAEPPEKKLEAGYTTGDLKQFLLSSSIKEMFPFVLDIKSTTEIFQRLTRTIYELETVQLDQLLDLYHLAIMMQTYQQLETHMGYRHELLDAVGEMLVALQPDDIEYIGINLCDRFVTGTGMARMEKVVDMHSSIVMLIKNSEVNGKIAMTTLLATLAKVSGVKVPERETDTIKQAFEMVKLVNWTQLVDTGREADMFVLVRSFSLIINMKENRSKHVDWHQGMGSDIHKFFMAVLRTVRFSRNYNFFAMMIERYIAFCVVRGATPRAYSTI